MVSAEDIYGGKTAEEAAKIFLNILKGEGTGHKMQLCLQMQQWHCIVNRKL